MTRLTAGDAQVAADLMSRLHPGWDVPGARRLLLDAADLAPAHELVAAGVLFAGQATDLRAPLADVFADRTRPWWRGLEEAKRTVRPGDTPRCAIHGLFEPCISCAADDKADTYRRHPLPDQERVDDLQRVVNAAGADRVRAAIGARNAIHLDADPGIAQDEQTGERGERE